MQRDYGNQRSVFLPTAAALITRRDSRLSTPSTTVGLTSVLARELGQLLESKRAAVATFGRSA